jgi:hypothetical protein
MAAIYELQLLVTLEWHLHPDQSLVGLKACPLNSLAERASWKIQDYGALAGDMTAGVQEQQTDDFLVRIGGGCQP